MVAIFLGCQVHLEPVEKRSGKSEGSESQWQALLKAQQKLTDLDHAITYAN